MWVGNPTLCTTHAGNLGERGIYSHSFKCYQNGVYAVVESYDVMQKLAVSNKCHTWRKARVKVCTFLTINTRFCGGKCFCSVQNHHLYIWPLLLYHSDRPKGRPDHYRSKQGDIFVSD